MIRRYNYVLQQNQNDCSIACLETILMYFNIKPDREKLLKSINFKSCDYNAYDIVKMAKAYNVTCFGIKTKVSKIKSFPIIAHVIVNKNYFHFIVIYKADFKRKKIIIMDPSSGIKEIDISFFLKISTGVFLIFKKNYNVKTDNKLKKFIKNILKDNMNAIVKTLFLSSIFIILSLVFSYYLNLILIYNSNTYFVFIIFVFYLVISITKNIISYVKNILVLKLNLSIDSKITNTFFNHLFCLPYSYFSTKSKGEIINIISDIEVFKDALINTFILSFIDLFLIIIIIIYMIFLNYFIGALVFLTVLLIFIITNRYKYIYKDFFMPYRVNNIKYSSYLIELLQGIYTIKNLNINNIVKSKLNTKYKYLKYSEKKYYKKNNKYDFIISFIKDISYVIIIYLVYRFSSNISDIVLFSSLYYLILSFINNILPSIINYKINEDKVDRVLELINLKKEKESTKKYSKINKIIYKNVSYNNILNNINFVINKKDKIYLSGTSGIGKTTLVKLLLKNIYPSDGTIKIDNINILDYSPYFLREKITYVSSHDVIFKGSIGYNLSLVSNNKTKINKCTKLTLFNKIIKKKGGYNYLIDEYASNLSGGEKCKLILTRALLKNNEVLILDEVFNEISIKEEKIILKNILEQYKDKIIILISHRNSNINLFNKKYVIKEDGIIEVI